MLRYIEASYSIGLRLLVDLNQPVRDNAMP
jgi:hypothetical protein